jgi:hypothetical protein
MDACLGSVGLLKMLLLRLAARQMQSASGVVTLGMLSKAGKSPKALDVLRKELKKGWDELQQACYGESELSVQCAALFRNVADAQRGGEASHAP